MELKKEDIKKKTAELYLLVPGNILPEEESTDPRCRGLRLFEEPVVGFGNADDSLFEKYREPGIVGPWFRTPAEWLPQAKTVISLFFPISEEVRKSNREAKEEASIEWLAARYEGQNYINRFMEAFSEWFKEEGIPSVVPSISEAFGAIHAGKSKKLSVPENLSPDAFSSNWSERHAAYVCGLGTFSLTRGVITEKGMAGRFASIIVGEELPADSRAYEGVYDYCLRCGACIERCPANAIRLLTGKDQLLCASFNQKSLEKYSPRYGCGLCQTGVPCEHERPFL